VLGFAPKERKRWGGRTWWVLAAGEGPEPEDGDLETWRTAALAYAAIETERTRRTRKNQYALGTGGTEGGAKIKGRAGTARTLVGSVIQTFYQNPSTVSNLKRYG
jgi:hypothetical protein